MSWPIVPDEAAALASALLLGAFLGMLLGRWLAGKDLGDGLAKAEGDAKRWRAVAETVAHFSDAETRALDALHVWLHRGPSADCDLIDACQDFHEERLDCEDAMRRAEDADAGPEANLFALRWGGGS